MLPETAAEEAAEPGAGVLPEEAAEEAAEEDNEEEAGVSAVIGWLQSWRQRLVHATLKPHITCPTLTPMRSFTSITPWK